MERLAGRYRVLGQLGAGALGTALRAHDLVRGEDVALKILRSDRPDLADVLRRELAGLRAIVHPALLEVFDFGVADGRPYYTARLVDGVPLDRAPATDRRRALLDAIGALAAMHARGMRHGDFKPENVLVDRAGRGVLIDLGCARPFGPSDVSGTPGYIAPELLRGEPGDARSDLYAVAMTIEAAAIDAPRELVARMRANDPRARPSSAGEVLEAFGEGAPLRPPSRARIPDIVGRANELGRIERALVALHEGREAPRAIAIEGPSGGGVSRLLREIVWRAQLRVAVHEANASQPGCVRSLVSRALDREIAPDLLALVDGHAQLSSGQPIVFAIDDFDQASADDREELRALLRSSERSTTLWLIGTHEDVVLPRADRVVLGALDRAATATWAGEAIGAGELDALFEATAGLPARIATVLERLEVGGGVLDVLARDWRVDAARDRIPAIERRLAAAEHEVERARAQAQLVRERARLGDAGAVALLRSSEPSFDAAPLAFREAAIACIGLSTHTEDRLAIARACSAGGDPRRALVVLARVLRERPPRAELARCEREIAAAALRSGQLRRSVRYADRAIAHGASEAIEIGCRARIGLGEYHRARADAQRALPSQTGAMRTELLECSGLAGAYLGLPAAGLELAEARVARDAAGNARERIRVRGYQAIVAFRAGDGAAALDEHRAALALAEQHGVSGMLASCLSNVATAAQHDGALGEALAAYERALRIAVAAGKDNTAQTIVLNLANLHAELGAFERAHALLAPLRATRLSPYCDALDAEGALHRGRLDDAAASAAGARDEFVTRGAHREAREQELVLAAVAIERGEAEVASGHLDRANGDDDVGLRAKILRARITAPEESIRALEPIATGSLSHGSRIDRLLTLASAYERAGAHTLAAGKRQAALELVERTAAALPETARAAYLAHPRHRRLASEGRRQGQGQGASQLDLTRFLEINKRLNSSLSAPRVLAAAIDAAIELTGAERGFVLLMHEHAEPRDDDGLEVAVARNLDREHVGKSHLKLSRSIAEQVIAKDEPIVTVDARTDERFRHNASVHAMRLTSVLCVPIRSPSGVLGALYLDNRFERGRFGRGDVDALLAFADQVAIAVVNARLHAALEARTRELEQERARVDAMLVSQAREIDRLRDEVTEKQAALELRYDYQHIVGRSPAMRRVLTTLDRVTDTTVPVLVLGESGTGKELVARALHFHGPRRDRRFATLNVAALPESLLESELFGHVRGAFTGADRDRQGVFVAADGGTLFLDELGEMSLAMQAKLLRVLQEREVVPLGSDRPIPFDVRLVCATNRDLEREVAEGRFREDLYYRVGVVTVRLPPLRERGADVLAIADRILERAATEHGRRKVLSPDARAALLRHPFPGNVRELENVLVRAVVLHEQERIEATDLELPRGRRIAKLPRTRKEFEAEEAKELESALRAAKWNVSEVARELGMPRNTLYRRLAKHGLMRK